MPPYHKVYDQGADRYRIRFVGLPDASLYVLQDRKEEDWPLATKALRRLDKVVVCELDDDYIGLPSWNPAFHGSHPKVSPGFNRNHLHKTVARADCLTVSTPALAERYSRLNSNVRVLRNYLDWEMWQDVPLSYEVERRRLRIGWLGKLEFREGDLEVLRGVLGPFLGRHPHVDFVAAGDHRVHDYLGVPDGQRVTYKSVHFSEGKLPSIVATFDIGLVPLRLGTFNDCKSHLKGMEYAACGIPCIASPSESYRDYWLKGKEIGLLAHRPKDWLRALELLVNDDELRREMGRRAREEASRHTIQEHYVQWESLYRELLGDRPKRRLARSDPEGEGAGLASLFAPRAAGRARDRDRLGRDVLRLDEMFLGRRPARQRGPAERGVRSEVG
jgi:glycosyltransferase involved in cell wall biosynthesis